jgi:hypothetical protein
MESAFHDGAVNAAAGLSIYYGLKLIAAIMRLVPNEFGDEHV